MCGAILPGPHTLSSNFTNLSTGRIYPFLHICKFVTSSSHAVLANTALSLFLSFKDFTSLFTFFKVGCGDMDWIELAQDTDRWRALVTAVMNLRVP
jgi:hypothetical protein